MVIVSQYRIESEPEADERLQALLIKPEYQSMNEDQFMAEVSRQEQQHITDPALKTYFINKAKEMFRAYRHEIELLSAPCLSSVRNRR